MGFKAWRNLGVLALAGASLVGCTSGTATKDTKVVAPAPPNNPYNVPANQPPLPNPNAFNTSQQQPQQPFPTGTNQGLQQRPITPGVQPTSGMANPSTSFNNGPQGSSGGAYLAPGFQNQNPGSNISVTQPTPSFPQSNNAPQPSMPISQPTGFGVNSPSNQTGYNPGMSPAPLAPLPDSPPPSQGFIPQPPGFGR